MSRETTQKPDVLDSQRQRESRYHEHLESTPLSSVQYYITVSEDTQTMVSTNFTQRYGPQCLT